MRKMALAVAGLMLATDALNAGSILSDDPIERRMRPYEEPKRQNAYEALGYTSEDEARDKRRVAAADDKRARRAARLAAQVAAGGIDGVAL